MKKTNSKLLSSFDKNNNNYNNYKNSKQNFNIQKKFSEETPEKINEKPYKHSYNNLNLPRNNIKKKILVNDISAQKVNLLPKGNYDSENNFNKKNNNKSLSFSPKRYSNINLSLSKSKNLIPIEEKINIIPWKIKKNILEGKKKTKFGKSNEKLHHHKNFVFQISKSRDISFTNKKNKSSSKNQKETSLKNDSGKIYLNTERNKISNNSLTLNFRKSLNLTKNIKKLKIEINKDSSATAKKKKKVINLSLDLSKVKLHENKKNDYLNNTDNLICNTEHNECTSKRNYKMLLNKDSNISFNNNTSRKHINPKSSNLNENNRELFKYEVFKNKIQKQIDKLKVKVNQNEFKKNIRFKYQLQCLKQKDQEKYTKLSDQLNEINNNITVKKYRRQSSLPINIEVKSQNYVNYNILYMNENVGRSLKNFQKIKSTEIDNICYEKNNGNESSGNSIIKKKLTNSDININNRKKSRNNLNKEFFQHLDEKEETNNLNNTLNKQISHLKSNLNENIQNFKKLNFSPNQKTISKFSKSFNKSFLENFANSFKVEYLNTCLNLRRNNEISNEHKDNNIDIPYSNNYSILKSNKNINANSMSALNSNKDNTINPSYNKKSEKIKNEFKKTTNIYDKFQERKLKELENIEIYSGDIDTKFIVKNLNSNFILERIYTFLLIKKYSYVKLSKFKYLCSRDKMNFDINLFKILKSDDNSYYIKMTLKKPIKMNYCLYPDKDKLNIKIQNNSLEFKNISFGLIDYINNGVL